jgi:transposase
MPQRSVSYPRSSNWTCGFPHPALRLTSSVKHTKQITYRKRHRAATDDLRLRRGANTRLRNGPLLPHAQSSFTNRISSQTRLVLHADIALAHCEETAHIANRAKRMGAARVCLGVQDWELVANSGYCDASERPPFTTIIDADHCNGDYFYANLREELNEHGAVIPNRWNRRQPFTFNKRLYKLRCRMESAFNRLKDFRRIATRYDRLARNYPASVCLAAALVWCLMSLDPSHVNLKFAA